jgi:GMP synthase-like glutamine amidotransferase
MFYVYEIARNYLGISDPVPRVLKTPRFRAYLQHIGRFALKLENTYIIPTNVPNTCSLASSGLNLPEEDMRRIWAVSSLQQLDLRETPALTGSVIPGAKYAFFNFLETTYWPGIGDALYLESFGRQDGPWSTYLPARGELPTASEDLDLKGAVLSGGVYCAFDQSLTWSQPTSRWVQQAIESGIRLIGLCFGCQFVAYSLGGTVTRNPCGYFLHQPDKVTYTGFIAPRLPSQVLWVAECHNDCVSTLPAEAELLGSSEHTAVEAWGIRDRVVCSQGHPEFSTAFMTMFWLPTLNEDGKITEAQRREGIQLYNEKLPGGPLLRELGNWLRETLR